MKTETIDFKTFCAGGSPAYIRAKKIIKELGLPKIKDIKSNEIKNSSIKAYSLFINPLAFFDLNFMIIAGSVVLVALVERAIAQSGMISIASMLSSILKIAFPMVALGSIIYLIGHAPIFF